MADSPAPPDKTPPPAPPPPGGFASWRGCAALWVACFVVDHATKYWAMKALYPTMEGTPIVTIVPGLLQLRYAENTGAAFSLFDGQVQYLAIFSFLASAGMAYFWYTLPAKETWGRYALALVLSGAVGNLIDRAWRGYVVDFIDAYYGQYHWPTFNIADSCICIGAGILAVQIMRGRI